MIRLNPLVLRLQETTPPPNASADEYNCAWYEITDEISYLPGGLYKGEVTYKACFNDLPNGIQTHTFAPAGLDLRGKWTVGGNEPGEPRETLELGTEAPREGLYVREDVDMRCNFLLTGFVKKNLTKAHKSVVDKLAELGETENESFEQNHSELDAAPDAFVPKPWQSNGADQTLTPIDSNTMFSPDSYLTGRPKPQSPGPQDHEPPLMGSEPGHNVGRYSSPQRENARSHLYSQTNNHTQSPASLNEKLSYREHEQKRQHDGAPQLPPLIFEQASHQRYSGAGEPSHGMAPPSGHFMNTDSSRSSRNTGQGFGIVYDPSIQAELPAHNSPVERSNERGLGREEIGSSSTPANAEQLRVPNPNVQVAQRLSTDYTWRPGLQPGAFI